MFQKLEWGIDVVVATAGNMILLEILADMSQAMADKRKKYYDQPFRFIYNTTGPKQVARSLKSRGYKPLVTVFSMCTPVPDLDQHLSFGDRGRVRCHLPGMTAYDILSAYSMRYTVGDPRPQPPQAKRRRIVCKTTVIQPENKKDEERPPSYEPQQSSLQSANIKQEAEAPAAEVDNPPLAKHQRLQPATRPGNLREKPKRLWGYKPQQSSPQNGNMTQEARDALDDMSDLFRLLDESTRAYLKALGDDGLAG